MFVEPSVVRLFLKMDSKVLPEKKNTKTLQRYYLEKKPQDLFYIRIGQNKQTVGKQPRKDARKRCGTQRPTCSYTQESHKKYAKDL